MTENKVHGIYKKLHAIMTECPYIKKDKENQHFHYSYASEAAIKDKLHELFVKHRVISIPSAVQQEIVEIGKTSKGDSRFRTTVAFSYRFIDIDDGSFVDASMPGAGVDGEDKGTYKAITGALKYCLTGTFIIPTGDDPENADGKGKEQKSPSHKGKESTTIGAPPNDVPTEDRSRPYVTDQQRKRLYAIVTKSKWKDDEVKAVLKDFGVNSSTNILKKDYDRICGIIENGDYATYIDFKTNSPAAS